MAWGIIAGLGILTFLGWLWIQAWKQFLEDMLEMDEAARYGGEDIRPDPIEPWEVGRD